MLMNRDQCVLVVVDIQEKLAPAVEGIGGILDTVACLVEAAAILAVPVVLTEHCPDRIGPVLPRLRESAAADTILPKVHFNAMDEERFRTRFRDLGRRCPIVCGTEAHVCVLQTAFGLKARGYAPVLVADAVGSRKRHDREAAISRMAGAGIPAVTAEMVLFEWLARGDTEEFRRLLAMIKALPAGPGANRDRRRR